jgi:hypothetical protein
MKTRNLICPLAGIAAALVSASVIQAQGTLTLDYPWIHDGIGYVGYYYDTNGMSFEVSDRAQLGASMARVGSGLAGHPDNGTPHLEPSSTLAPTYVIFSLTNAAAFGYVFTNGAPFGLVSVDLADPVAPSLSPVSITFNGFRGDGSMVSQTFTTPGGGASSFQTYTFGPDFASDLVRVEIPSAAWAMDNIRWVPEPGFGSLLALGLLAFAARRRCHRKK